VLLNAAFDFLLNVVFNDCMNSLEQDRALIENLGGPSKVAELLGYDKDGGAQRVQNWLTRGIPAAVKLERPDLFLPQFKPARKPVKQEH
jgi:hypothetical protein